MWIYFRKHTGYYYVGWSNGIQDFCRSTRQKSIDGARAWAKAAKIKEMEIASRLQVQIPRFMSMTFTNTDYTLESALETFEVWAARGGRLSPTTVYTYCIQLKQWLKRMKAGGRSPSSVTSEEIYDYLYRPEWNASIGTIGVHKSSLWKFFEYMRNEGIIQGNPVSNVRINGVGMAHERLEPLKRQPFTEEEIAKILAKLKGFYLIAAKLSLATGLRMSDIVGLEWDSWPGRDRTIIVHTDKTGARVEFKEIPQDIVDDLKARWETRDQNSPYVFPTEQSRFSEPVDRCKLSLRFSNKLRSCGVFKKSFHCFRHTYITRRRSEGAPLTQIAEEVGHANTTTTEIYVHAQPPATEQPTNV